MFQRREFERVAPESVGLRSGDIEWLIDQLESGFTEPHGLMIMRHGKVCAEGWWSPYAPGIRHGLQSHTKTYAATAVGIAYTEGILKLDERLIDIFPEESPENPSEYLQMLTVHDVLCMGCGMDEMPRPSKDWIKEFLATPVNHKPGTTYMYNSTGSSMLGAIVRKKTGLGLHDYLKTRLYDKIGIHSDNHKWMYMPDGMEVGGGGLYATTEDNLRLMKLYADGGVWDGERILAEDYVKLATTLQNESATEEKVNPPAKDNFVGYGYQIWMCRPEGVYRADGAMGQFTIVIPSLDMIIAITENAAGAHWAQTTLDVMWEYLERVKAQDEVVEDEKAAKHLKNRMSRLALPRVPYAPFSTWTDKVDGKRYVVEEGDLYVTEVGMAHFMAGLPLPDKIESFRFAFKPDTCQFIYQTNGTEKTLEIALDGSRRDAVLLDGVADQALVSGAWVQDNCFELRTRFIETCSEAKRTFTFGEDKVEIASDSIRKFFGHEDPPVIAVQRD